MSAPSRLGWLGELGTWPFVTLALLALGLCVTRVFDRPEHVAPLGGGGAGGGGEYLRMPPRFYIAKEDQVRLTQPAAALHAAEPARARIEEGFEGGVRVTIDALAPQEVRHDWDIQLVACEFPVAAGDRFHVSWEARADEARSVVAHLSQSASPWGNLGYYQSVPLERSWRRESAELVASQADREARLVFNLGAAAAAVEIRNVAVRRLQPMEER